MALIPVNELTKQFFEMANAELLSREMLSKHQAALDETIKGRQALAIQLLAGLNEQREEIFQEVLRLDYLAGDETVERDPAAGNGPGGYRRKQVETIAYPAMDKLLGMRFERLEDAVSEFHNLTSRNPTGPEEGMLRTRVRMGDAQ